MTVGAGFCRRPVLGSCAFAVLAWHQFLELEFFGDSGVDFFKGELNLYPKVRAA